MKNISLLFTIFITGAVVFFMFGCSSKQPETQLEKTIGQEVFETLKNPSQVSVFAVMPKFGGGYKAVTDEVSLTKGQVEVLQKTVLDDSSYYFDKKKRCVFLPQVAFRFKNEKEVLVLVSLTCFQVQFHSDDQVVTLDYDPIKEKLNTLVESLRPKE